MANDNETPSTSTLPLSESGEELLEQTLSGVPTVDLEELKHGPVPEALVPPVKEDPWVTEYWKKHADCLDYLIEPLNRNIGDGFIPRGAVSAIAGPSGAGKTSWTLRAFQRWSQGSTFCGRKTKPFKFGILALDRGYASIVRTCLRLHIDPDTLNVYRPTKADKMAAATQAQAEGAGSGNARKKFVANLLRKVKALPQFAETTVFLIEGADLKAPSGKQGDLAGTAEYLESLRDVADELGLYILVSVGCPKLPSDEQYVNLRERLIGSTAWGRMVESIFLVQTDDKDSTRTLYLIPRDGVVEERFFDMKDGKLTEVDQKAKDDAAVTQKAEVVKYIETTYKIGDKFGPADLRKAGKWGQQTVYNAIKQLGNRVETGDNGKYCRLGTEYCPATRKFLEALKPDEVFTDAQFDKAVKATPNDCGDLIARLTNFSDRNGREIGIMRSSGTTMVIERLPDETYKRWMPEPVVEVAKPVTPQPSTGVYNPPTNADAKAEGIAYAEAHGGKS